MIDYRLDSVVDVFTEHEGAVRAIDFHTSQPLFVSGADDFIVKVWNYNLRRCLFSLYGHTDYIRSTFFHSSQPWIVSASDDYTIRLWNWQSRSCMATLPGHSHFVMCAKFLPEGSQLISCSLDKTIRVWDISTVQEQSNDDFGLADFLGTADVAVIHEVEAHEKGVNWVDCHPTQNYVASCADDRTVRIWKVSRSSFLPISRCVGHSQNVCCVMFFKQYVISNSEDHTIRVWDGWQSYPSCIKEHRRPAERYWMLGKDEDRNLFAAGHDTGCEIFKLARERPAFCFEKDELYCTFNGALRSFNTVTLVSKQFKHSSAFASPYNLSMFGRGTLLVSSETTTRLIKFDSMSEVMSFPNTTDFVVTGPNKFVAITDNELVIYNTDQSKEPKKLGVPFRPSRIFPSTPGTILCYADNKLYLYHLAQQNCIAELPVVGVKYVVWDKRLQRVALLAKNSITVATKTLSVITCISESASRVKSAVFDETRDILYFSTLYHLKYCNLLNGEVSTQCTLQNTIYLMRASNDRVLYFARTGDVKVKHLNSSELVFKQKLHQGAFREVIKILNQGTLKGQALVGYLHKHHHSEVALQFVKDPLTRFYLALECGNLQIAKEMASELNDQSTWRKLCDAAMVVGDIQLAQLSSIRAENYRSSAFLSLITGNSAAIGHLVDTTQDDHFKLQYGMHLDDARQRIRVLVDAGQLSLAYLTAKSYNLEDLAEAISVSLEPEVLERLSKVQCYSPPERAAVEPVTDNWPMLRQEESLFARILRDGVDSHSHEFEVELEENAAEAGGWNDDEIEEELDGGADSENDADADDGAGWGDEELDIDVTAALSKVGKEGKAHSYVAPISRPSITSQWTKSSIPAYHAAAGSFETTLSILKRQICLQDPTPLKPYLMNIWSCANCTRPSAILPSQIFPLSRQGTSSATSVPLLPKFEAILDSQLKKGYQLFLNGRFPDALVCFERVLHQAVFTTPADADVRSRLRGFIERASTYARSLALQIRMRSEDPSSTKALSMALYFTHFPLLRAHLILALSQAMTKAYKKKNYQTAATVARRLVDQEPPKAKADQATAIIIDAEGKADSIDAKYDSLNPFVLCAVSFTPMYVGTVKPIHCPYCETPALPQYQNTLCPTCHLSPLGGDGAGLWNDV